MLLSSPLLEALQAKMHPVYAMRIEVEICDLFVDPSLQGHAVMLLPDQRRLLPDTFKHQMQCLDSRVTRDKKYA